MTCWQNQRNGFQILKTPWDTKEPLILIQNGYKYWGRKHETCFRWKCSHENEGCQMVIYTDNEMENIINPKRSHYKTQKGHNHGPPWTAEKANRHHALSRLKYEHNSDTTFGQRWQSLARSDPTLLIEAFARKETANSIVQRSIHRNRLKLPSTNKGILLHLCATLAFA